MKKYISLLLFLSVSLLTCKHQQFQRQKYTSLRPLKADAPQAPPDSLSSEIKPKKVYLKTDYELYRVRKPHYDSTENKIIGRNIHSSLRGSAPRGATIIYMDEQDYEVADELPMESIDSLTMRDKKISKDEIHSVKDDKTLKKHKEQGRITRREAKVARTKISGGLSILFILLTGAGVYLMVTLINSKNSADSGENSEGCLAGLITSLLLFLLSIILWGGVAVLTAFFLLLAIIFLIFYFTWKKDLKQDE